MESKLVPGPLRMFTCVDVLPSTDVARGEGVDGTGVSDGRAVCVGGRVTVMMTGAGVSVLLACMEMPQLDINRLKAKRRVVDVFGCTE